MLRTFYRLIIKQKCFIFKSNQIYEKSSYVLQRPLVAKKDYAYYEANNLFCYSADIHR